MLKLFNINTIGDRQIICFGAGGAGKNLLQNWDVNFMKYNIIAFTDNNPELWGSKIYGGNSYVHGIDIIDIDKFIKTVKEHDDILIVITSTYVEEVLKQLKNNGIKNDIIQKEEFIVLTNIELTEKALIPLSNKLGVNICPLYQNRIWGGIDSFSILFIRYMLDYEYNNKDFVYLLSPPKTGNHSVFEALTRCGINNANTHSLCMSRMFKEKSYFEIFKNYIPKIIIGIRDPIAQHISYMFSNISNIIPIKEDVECRNAEQIFNDIFIRHCNADNYYMFSELNRESEKCGYKMGYENLLVENFFDGHILEGFGIDFYSLDFDKESGWKIYERKLENGFVQKILLYKLEKLDVLESVFKEFLENDSFKLQHAYKGESQFYKKCYKEFLDNIKLPIEYIDSMYGSKYIKHFYNEEEIERFKNKWKSHV